MGISASQIATSDSSTGIQKDRKRQASDVKKILEKALTKRVDKLYSSQTQKYSRGKKFETRTTSYEEVATIYVWHEKNFTKLPRWMTGTGFATGHAAMKLSRFDPAKRKNIQIEYISWWPGDQADKESKGEAGKRSGRYFDDKLGEMTSNTEIKLILTMQFMRRANMDTPEALKLFADAAKIIWTEGISKSQRTNLKALGVNENFTNLDRVQFQIKDNQRGVSRPAKRLKELQQKEGSHQKLIQKYEKLAREWTIRLDSSKVNKKTLINTLSSVAMLKEPYAKIYLPCSSFPIKVGRKATRTPWGLSLDAMRMAFRSYEPGLREYKMQDYKGNCIGAVWVTLRAGLADVYIDYKVTTGAMRNFAHITSLLPSDAVKVSQKLSSKFAILEQQQQMVDGLALYHLDEVRAIFERYEFTDRNWSECLTNYRLWRKVSDGRGARHPLKESIDRAMNALASYEKKLQMTEKKMIEYLLKLEGRWEVRRRDSVIIKRLQAEVDDDPFGMVPPATLEKLKKLKENSGKALVAWEKELEGFEKIRRARAKHLLVIHQKIFNYIQKIYKRKDHSNRFYSALMLSQIVAWRFVEVTHDNLAIRLDEIDGMGFTLSKGELDKRLGEVFPHLKQVVDKPGTVVNLTGID